VNYLHLFQKFLRALFAAAIGSAIAALFAGVFFCFWPVITAQIPAPVDYPQNFKKRLLVIDPGHGGENEGAKTFWGLFEKRRNLRIAWALKRRMEAGGHWIVRLTRDREMYLTNSLRPQIANEFEADIYISIHGNAWFTSRQGFSVIWYAAQKEPLSEKLAFSIAESLRTAGFPMDMKMGPSFRNFHENRENTPDYQLWSDTLPIYVREKTNHPMIYPAKMPAVLIETHYMSDPKQALQYESRLMIDRLCKGIEGALVKFASDNID
jgi:N-acetylmuramoyl-L-alanine amidase